MSFRPLDARDAPEHLRNVRFGLAWCKENAPATAIKFVELATLSTLDVVIARGKAAP
jgi:hypothetical protein